MSFVINHNPPFLIEANTLVQAYTKKHSLRLTEIGPIEDCREFMDDFKKIGDKAKEYVRANFPIEANTFSQIFDNRMKVCDGQLTRIGRVSAAHNTIIDSYRLYCVKLFEERICSEKKKKEKEKAELLETEREKEKAAENRLKAAIDISKFIDTCFMKLHDSLSMHYKPEGIYQGIRRPAEWVPDFNINVMNSIQNECSKFIQTLVTQKQIHVLRQYIDISDNDPILLKVPIFRKDIEYKLYNVIFEKAASISHEKADRLRKEHKYQEARLQLEKEERQAKLIAKEIIKLQGNK